MAFASGPVSFQRFSITGTLSDDITDKFVEALSARAFGRSGTRADDTQIGWIGPHHLFETEIAPEHIAFGSFAHLALRVDHLRVPPNVLRAYVRMEEEATLEARQRAFLNRGEKRKARAAAALRAEQEARAGGFRRMSSCPVLIDLAHRTLFLGSLGASMADKVMQLFSDTFGAALEPITPEYLALRSADQQRQTRALESLAPFHLVAPPAGFGQPADFSGADLNFLGKELLTWLWYQIDADDEPLRVKSGDEITVMIDRTLRLKCDFGLTGTDTIMADSPASLPEAKAALHIGKQPTKLGLIVGSPLGEFRFTLDGERLSVSSLALPDDDTEQDPSVRHEQRFELITDLANLVDALFELFMLWRLGHEWDTGLRAMSAWAAGKPGQRRLRVTRA